MAKNEQENQKKSSFDRARNLIQNGQNAYQNAKRLKNIYQTVKKGRAAVTAGEVAIATSEIWVPIVLIILIIVLFVVLISTLFGGTQNVKAGQIDCLTVPQATCQVDAASCPTGTSPDSSGTYSCSATGAGTPVCCIPPTSNGSDIVRWASIISNAETSGCASSPWYNRLWQTITNGSYTIPYYPGNCSGEGTAVYFCTYLIRDAYKLAGVPGPTNSWTCAQISQINNLGFRIQGNDIRGVTPGDMIYWGFNYSNGTRWCSAAGFYVAHVDMVYAINITDDVNGNGSMQTLDSNADRKMANYTIRGWKIVSTPWAFNTWQFAIKP